MCASIYFSMFQSIDRSIRDDRVQKSEFLIFGITDFFKFSLFRNFSIDP